MPPLHLDQDSRGDPQEGQPSDHIRRAALALYRFACLFRSNLEPRVFRCVRLVMVTIGWHLTGCESQQCSPGIHPWLRSSEQVSLDGVASLSTPSATEVMPSTWVKWMTLWTRAR